MRAIGRHETSAINYHSQLCESPKRTQISICCFHHQNDGGSNFPWREPRRLSQYTASYAPDSDSTVHGWWEQLWPWYRRIDSFNSRLTSRREYIGPVTNIGLHQCICSLSTDHQLWFMHKVNQTDSNRKYWVWNRIHERQVNFNPADFLNWNAPVTAHMYQNDWSGLYM